jgi:hypothetical protein
VTLKRHLLAHRSDRREELYKQGCLNKYSAAWLWPDLSGIGFEALAGEKSRIFEERRAGDLNSAFRDFRKDPGEGFSRLKWGRRRAGPRVGSTIRPQDAEFFHEALPAAFGGVP